MRTALTSDIWMLGLYCALCTQTIGMQPTGEAKDSKHIFISNKVVNIPFWSLYE